jgi:hypothetical protein
MSTNEARVEMNRIFNRLAEAGIPADAQVVGEVAGRAARGCEPIDDLIDELIKLHNGDTSWVTSLGITVSTTPDGGKVMRRTIDMDDGPIWFVGSQSLAVVFLHFCRSHNRTPVKAQVPDGWKWTDRDQAVLATGPEGAVVGWRGMVFGPIDGNGRPVPSEVIHAVKDRSLEIAAKSM